MNESPEIIFDCDGQSLASVERKLEGIVAKGVKSVTLLVAAKFPHTSEEMNRFLTRIPVDVSGGVFPEVIYNSQYYDNALIAVLWFDDLSIETFEEVSKSDSSLYDHRLNFPVTNDKTSSLVFSNAMTREAEATLDALYYRNGQVTQYAGAGSAYCGECADASVITNHGLVADAIQIVRLPYPQETQVGHGWSVLSGPHLVTSADKNRIKTLDYQAIKPYFESIINQCRGSTDAEADESTLQKMLQEHPVGIQPYDEDMIVRDILRYDDETEEFEFIGDIPEFSNIYILTGQQDSLLQYVKDNVWNIHTCDARQSNLSLIFSCIGRRYHMGDKSNEELKLLFNHLGNTDRVIGASTLGEIASNETGLARLHSMSLVVTNLCT